MADKITEFNVDKCVAMEIVEIFETFLQNHGIDIPNEDREQDEDACSIYGMDYAQLLDEVHDVLEIRMKENLSYES